MKKAKIQIGVTDYEIQQVADSELIENHGDDAMLVGGDISTMQSLIRINNSYPKQTKLQTFWHEVVHAMLDEIGVQQLNDDEGFVEALGKQLYGLFKNNDLKKIYNFLGADDN